MALQEKGDLARASAACRRAIRLFARHTGPGSPDTAHARVELAGILNLQDRWQEAARCCGRAARDLRAPARDKNAPRDIHELALRSLLVRATSELQLGRHALVEKILGEAKRLAVRNFGPRSERVASVLNQFGMLRKVQGRYTEAIAVYLRTVAILRALPRPPRLHLAALYHNLGGSEYARGQFVAAEAYARRGLAIRRLARGARHPETAADLGALAAILDARGKHAAAERLYRRALAIFQRAFGRSSYEAAVVWENLGVLHHRTGHHRRAARELGKALLLERKLLGARHAEVGMTMSNLGVVHLALNEPIPAARLLRQGLMILVTALGRSHPHVRQRREVLAKLQPPKG